MQFLFRKPEFWQTRESHLIWIESSQNSFNMKSAVLALLALISSSAAVTYDFEKQGGVRDKDDLDTSWANGRLLNETLASLVPGDTLVFPNATFTLMGGIKCDGLQDVTISFDGTIVFKDDIDAWPKVSRLYACV